MKVSTQNCKIVLDGKYYRVIILLGTHKLHSEKLNLATAIDVRDKFVFDI